VPEQGALAATAAPHDDERLASMNVERDTIEYHAIAESPDEMFYFDDGRVSGHEQNDECRMPKHELMSKLEWGGATDI
jgi:hypothetical protein